MASNANSRGAVRHRQHLQFAQTHLPLHCKLPPWATADLTGEDAAGHPQVSFYLLSGRMFHSCNTIEIFLTYFILLHRYIFELILIQCTVITEDIYYRL